MTQKEKEIIKNVIDELTADDGDFEKAMFILKKLIDKNFKQWKGKSVNAFDYFQELHKKSKVML